jgi:hypothetical protein
MRNYLLDVEFRTSLRVDAPDARAARKAVDDLAGNLANFGAWPNGDPVLGEIVITMRGIVEQDGEPVRNGDAR